MSNGRSPEVDTAAGSDPMRVPLIVREAAGAVLRRAGRRLTLALRVAADRRRLARVVRDHRKRRWQEIAPALAAAPPGYVLLAGDSHAEHMGRLPFWPPVINAGVGGARAGAYAADLDRLPGAPRARFAILVIGANDTAPWLKPRTRWRVRAFDAAILRILAWLRAHADVVLVAAPPPIRPTASIVQDLEAMRSYTQRLEDLCRSTGSRFIDPFAAVRADDPVLIRPEVATDPGGGHLADYTAVVGELASILSRTPQVMSPPP